MHGKNEYQQQRQRDGQAKAEAQRVGGVRLHAGGFHADATEFERNASATSGKTRFSHSA